MGDDKENINKSKNSCVRSRNTILYFIFVIFSFCISVFLGFFFIPFILDLKQYFIYILFFIVCILLLILNCLFLRKTNFSLCLRMFISSLITLFPFIITAYFFSNALLISDIPITNDINQKNIQINLMTNLNNKTKDEILKNRKKYVEKSIFAFNNYSPNKDIWTNISDNLPWENIYSATCKNNEWTDEYYLNGWSSESRFINNPAILVGITLSDKYNAKKYQRCEGTIIWCIPNRLSYYPKDNLIIAYYNDLQAFNNNSFKINTINAQDFGYKYIYINEKLSNLQRTEVNTYRNDILILNSKFYTDLTDIRYKNGVNKISEYSDEYKLTSGLLRNNLQDKEVEFKLWKQKPSNIYSKADFTYKIIFQVSYKDKNSFVDNVVKGDTAKGIYYKILNKIKPNYFSYKMKKY